MKQEPDKAKAKLYGRRAALLALPALFGTALLALLFFLWAVGTASGTQWLLREVPGLQVEAPQGSLLGDFSAQRLAWAGTTGKVDIQGLQWQGLSLVWNRQATLWVDLVLQKLQADRLQLQWPSDDSPSSPPQQLSTPLGLHIAALQIGELVLPALSAKPVKDLQASLEINARELLPHQLWVQQLHWDLLQLQGQASVASQGAMNVAAALTVNSAPGNAAPWAATILLDGPLQQIDLQATLSSKDQSLKAAARLLPFADWPLQSLQASTEGLNLAALLSGAPVTALTGQAKLLAPPDQAAPLQIKAELSNKAAGRWNEQRLPLRQLVLDVDYSRASAALQIRQLDLLLGSAAAPAGRLRAIGASAADSGSQLSIALEDLDSAGLDQRLIRLSAGGKLQLSSAAPLEKFTAAPLQLQVDLKGRLQRLGRDTPIKLQAQALLGYGAELLKLQLRSLRLQAEGAQLDASGEFALKPGQLTQGWQASSELRLQVQDLRRFWPGAKGSAWQAAPLEALLQTRLQADPTSPTTPQGTARLQLLPGRLAGLAISADLQYQRESGLPQLSGSLRAGDNQVELKSSLSADLNHAFSGDLQLQAPRLAGLQPLLDAITPQLQIQGSLHGKASLQVRKELAEAKEWSWHSLAELQAKALRIELAGAATQIGQANWQGELGSERAATLLSSLKLEQFSQGGSLKLQDASLSLKGSWAQHQLLAHANADWLLPAALTPGRPGQRAQGPLSLSLQGALDGSPAQAWREGLQWHLSAIQMLARPQDPGMAPWLNASGLSAELAWSPQRQQAWLNPGRVELAGAGLQWQQLRWDDGWLALDAKLEPLAVAPLLQRWQKDFGWGGDLVIGGEAHLSMHPELKLALSFQRRSGDLNLTEDRQQLKLGLSELSLDLQGSPGLWQLRQRLAGSNLGTVSADISARNAATWPDAGSSLAGSLEASVANLNQWGAWLPAGWRVGGNLFAKLALGGQLGLPEITGRAGGAELVLRNPLLGIAVDKGEFALQLNGSTALLERLEAHAGQGKISATGQLALGAKPHAELALSAEQFGLLSRVDQRLSLSGKMQLQLSQAAIDLQGRLSVDEGLFDFSRGNAPQLDEDVEVLRPQASRAALTGKAASKQAIKLKLNIALGDKLRLRGHGIDTLLRGDLLLAQAQAALAQAQSALALSGDIFTAGGTFNAYGQKLEIETGRLSFTGPLDNPRIDVLAVRPGNDDVRAGVTVTGSALAPRIKLFSDPLKSDNETLSWLLLGRAPDELGRADSALLQRAAMALLSGDGEGRKGRLTKTLGLDDLSVSDSGVDAKGTVVRLGKQLSKRWYVGYERGLNATTGSWQLIYRIAQRFTLRGQSGDDNALDLIWQWKWD